MIFRASHRATRADVEAQLPAPDRAALPGGFCWAGRAVAGTLATWEKADAPAVAREAQRRYG